MPQPAVIFDLDNCLSPATAVGEGLFEPAFEAIRAVNGGRLSDASLRSAFDACWYHAFDWVAREFEFSEAMRQAGWDAMARLEVNGPMTGYDDLHMLGDIAARRFLVTSGFARLQASKVRALGIEHQFERVGIDAIDAPVRQGKRAMFERLIGEYGLAPTDVVVVGDNPDSELAAARELGLFAVQTLRPGVHRTPDCHAHVSGLAGLKRLIESRHGAARNPA